MMSPDSDFKQNPILVHGEDRTVLFYFLLGLKKEGVYAI